MLIRTLHTVTLLSVFCGFMPSSADAQEFATCPAEMIAEDDLDGDNRISAEEFTNRRAHFDRIDSNGDGYLTRTEIAVFLNAENGGGIDRDGEIAKVWGDAEGKGETDVGSHKK